MRKTVLTILGAALIVASAVQIAAAAEPNKGRKADRAPAPVSAQVRNANAAWSYQSAEPDWSRYKGGAVSAPAGR
jgi:hypothetical protein